MQKSSIKHLINIFFLAYFGFFSTTNILYSHSSSDYNGHSISAAADSAPSLSFALLELLSGEISDARDCSDGESTIVLRKKRALLSAKKLIEKPIAVQKDMVLPDIPSAAMSDSSGSPDVLVNLSQGFSSFHSGLSPPAL